jgi:putative membrane protein insertion efficiency factor
MLLWLIQSLIRAYRYFLSPLLGQRCRFTPSCSSYAIDALSHRGIFNGCFLIIKRILRCHPFAQGGYDPVPEIKSKCQPK